MAYSLADKVVLITGASSGIGRAVALEVAAKGASVVLAARRHDLLQAVANEVSKRGGTPLVVPTDMAVTSQVEALAAKALEHFGRVDILVNNAGYGQMGPIESVGEAAVRQQFDVNVFGLLTLTRQLIPQMRSCRQGRIVNLSSVAGKVAFPFMGIYNASKHAVEAISDAMRMELAPFGIRTIVIEPGPVETEFFQVAERQAASDINTEDNPYGAILQEVGENFNGSSNGFAWSAERTAKTIVRAIEADSPSDRYTAFQGGKLALGLMTALPTAVADRIYSKWFGLDQLKADSE
jgi:NAD(P)-dependent dehydrogenase (short-subunit alcohol dehydrogenase family)